MNESNTTIKFVFLEILAKCELSGFLLRRSHIIHHLDLIIMINVIMTSRIIAQIVLYPLLGLKNVSTLTLLALCMEIVAMLVDIIKIVILCKLHTRPTFYLIIYYAVLMYVII